MKAVMYHYVREYRSSHPYFRFLDIEDFRKQLDYFGERCGFVSRDSWERAVKDRSLAGIEGEVVLTFDDSMRCHFDYVFPELQRRGLWGIFYVPVQPYMTGRVLDVHRVHLLLGAIEGRRLLEVLLGILSDDMVPDSKIEAFRKATYLMQSNREGVSEFKRILNYYVGYEFREGLIDKVAKSVGYEFDVEGFYVSVEGLREMVSCGNIIGSHTLSHPVMSKLTPAEQSFEIKESFAFLDGLVSQCSKTYCHPYGGFHSFNDSTVEILTREGVDYSFNVELRDIEAGDLISSRQFLPRFDCNEFPYGQAS